MDRVITYVFLVFTILSCNVWLDAWEQGAGFFGSFIYCFLFASGAWAVANRIHRA